MLAHAEQIRAAQQMSGRGSWCGKQGHAPRLPAPKPHYQHAQAQAPRISSSSSSSSSSSEKREDSEESASSSDSG